MQDAPWQDTQLGASVGAPLDAPLDASLDTPLDVPPGDGGGSCTSLAPRPQSYPSRTSTPAVRQEHLDFS